MKKVNKDKQAIMQLQPNEQTLHTDTNKHCALTLETNRHTNTSNANIRNKHKQALQAKIKQTNKTHKQTMETNAPN